MITGTDVANAPLCVGILVCYHGFSYDRKGGQDMSTFFCWS